MPFIERHLQDRRLVIVSNREPYEHVKGPHGIETRTPPGGLVSALDPTMRRTHGVWVAWGSGSADRETTDADGLVQVPPDDPAYTLHRVWLDSDDVEGYYQGFANSVLWPICHLLLQHLDFRVEQWERYKAVNERFARAVAEDVARDGGEPLVWIQDYHFGLVARMLRDLRPELFIHQFWHIPFPPPDILRLLPSGPLDSLLRGMLGNDLLEFHTERHARNFLDCVAQLIPDAAVDHGRMTVSIEDRMVAVGAFPISIDVEHYEALASSSQAVARAETFRARYARDGRQLGLSVDRLDYTKGIPERLRALELLWEETPEMRERFTMLVIATPSRTDIEAYSALEREVVDYTLDINQRFGTPDWTPIVLINSNVDADLLASAYRAADLCLVSSLQDGMNLVAKEFIACQVDERGVLVLSKFTGAAEEIDGALLINPFNVDGFAHTIRRAVEMPVLERQERMRRMREQLEANTIFDWLDAILSRAALLMRAREHEAEREREHEREHRLRVAAPGTVSTPRPPLRDGRSSPPGPAR